MDLPADDPTQATGHVDEFRVATESYLLTVGMADWERRDRARCTRDIDD